MRSGRACAVLRAQGFGFSRPGVRDDCPLALVGYGFIFNFRAQARTARGKARFQQLKLGIRQGRWGGGGAAGPPVENGMLVDLPIGYRFSASGISFRRTPIRRQPDSGRDFSSGEFLFPTDGPRAVRRDHSIRGKAACCAAPNIGLFPAAIGAVRSPPDGEDRMRWCRD